MLAAGCRCASQSRCSALERRQVCGGVPPRPPAHGLRPRYPCLALERRRVCGNALCQPAYWLRPGDPCPHSCREDRFVGGHPHGPSFMGCGPGDPAWLSKEDGCVGTPFANPRMAAARRSLAPTLAEKTGLWGDTPTAPRSWAAAPATLPGTTGGYRLLASDGYMSSAWVKRTLNWRHQTRALLMRETSISAGIS